MTRPPKPSTRRDPEYWTPLALAAVLFWLTVTTVIILLGIAGVI